jgi:hypothetical protein
LGRLVYYRNVYAERLLSYEGKPLRASPHGEEYAQLLNDMRVQRRPALIADSLRGAVRAYGRVLMDSSMTAVVWAAGLFTVAGIGFAKLERRRVPADRGGRDRCRGGDGMGRVHGSASRTRPPQWAPDANGQPFVRGEAHARRKSLRGMEAR